MKWTGLAAVVVALAPSIAHAVCLEGSDLHRDCAMPDKRNSGSDSVFYRPDAGTKEDSDPEIVTESESLPCCTAHEKSTLTRKTHPGRDLGRARASNGKLRNSPSPYGGRGKGLRATARQCALSF